MTEADNTGNRTKKSSNYYPQKILEGIVFII